ncbi:MAG: hypothetical protein M1831_001765 [Alyxoria varia]|nr:MAG: hypothetical protein M1831_001765 [Alyxoria varia]
MGAGGDKNPSQWTGWWGNLGSQPQKGITTYSLSSNRQKPLAGAWHAAIFNSWRRFRGQVFYVAPPFVLVYLIVGWAERRNKYLNSKAGMRDFEEAQ